tara:strand:- start:506 stop:1285 length:780 start_codon:yes stop_codon:yes gene_type:complete
MSNTKLMQIQETSFYDENWLWSGFLKYLIIQLKEYKCFEHSLPSEFQTKESIYGSKKNSKKVNLYTWASKNKRISLARAVCIDSPTYSVLNFLIIPNSKFNMPFFGVDFVSLPNAHLLVLDFQPSISLEKQFSQKLLNQIIRLRNNCHRFLPRAETMSQKFERFFSPGLIWSRLPKTNQSNSLITCQLYNSFQQYLDLYLSNLFQISEIEESLRDEIISGQKHYLMYRRENDPARPMLRSLFGNDFTESLIDNVLFNVK